MALTLGGDRSIRLRGDPPRDPHRGRMRCAAMPRAHDIGLAAAPCGLTSDGSGSPRSPASRFATERSAIAEAHDLRVWRLRSLHELGTIDMLERADSTLLEQARSLASELGAIATATFLDIELCATYLISGDDGHSIAHGRAATERARGLGQVHAATAALQLLATTYVVAGDRTAAREAAELARRLDDDELLDAFLRVAVDGLCALLDEDRPAATTTLDAAMHQLRSSPTSPPASWKGLWPLILAVERRDQDAADAIVEVTESGATVNRLNLGYVDYARAVLSGRRAPDEAPKLVAEGDRCLQHGPFWHQLGRRLVAEAAIADGWGDPETWAREAGAYFDARGHGPIAMACVALGAPASTTVLSSWAFADLGVTRREAEALALVREGLTNKEIAERLYLSPRTVEKHIESLLRKTATRSRTQLATLADQSASGAP